MNYILLANGYPSVTNFKPLKKTFSSKGRVLRTLSANLQQAMDSLAILVAAESLVNLCGKVNAYIQWLTSKFSDRDRQSLLQVLRFEIGSLAYVFEAISVHLGDDETSPNPFKSFEDTHLQRLLDAMNECRVVLSDLTGMLQPTVVQPTSSKQQRGRSPSVGVSGVNWEMLPILKKKFGLYRKGMGLSLRTIEL
jgi:hypothetical protein